MSADNKIRVDRGGSWVNNIPAWVRAAYRGAHAPSGRYIVLGFRGTRGCKRAKT